MSALEIDMTVADLALTAATVETGLQVIAPSTNKVRCGMVGNPPRPIEVSFDGVSATDKPVLLQVMRQTTAIGGSPTTVTPVKHRNGEAGTVQTTAKKSAGGSEPTSSDIYKTYRLHPQGRHFLPDQFIVEQGDRLGFVFTAPANVNVSISCPAEE
jgi:hypothetical protein